VRIEPLLDRAVFFLSDRMLHRVLPARAARYCFTLWIDGDGTNSDEDVFLRQKHLDASIPDISQMLACSALQRAVSRAIYREEYADSLQQCMGEWEPAAAAEMLASHRAQLAVRRHVDACRDCCPLSDTCCGRQTVESNQPLASLVDALRATKLRCNAPGSHVGVDSAISCAHCSEAAGPPYKRCDRCRRQEYSYCSRRCQRLHWAAGHQHECQRA
jgi:hypothetical protein